MTAVRFPESRGPTGNTRRRAPLAPPPIATTGTYTNAYQPIPNTDLPETLAGPGRDNPTCHPIIPDKPIMRVLFQGPPAKSKFLAAAGPNAGGMGAVASRQLIAPDVLARIVREIVRPTVDGLAADGLPSRGFLYFGLIPTPEGP